jgi:hypothetical protein
MTWQKEKANLIVNILREIDIKLKNSSTIDILNKIKMEPQQHDTQQQS